MPQAEEDKTVRLGKDRDRDRAEEQEASPGSTRAPRAKLVCLDTSALEDSPDQLELVLKADAELYVGRDESCSVCLKSRKLSRTHARVFPGDGVWGIEDLNSTNGVFVNNRRTGRAWLRPGDEVAIGPIKFRLELDRPATAEVQPLRPQSVADDDAIDRTMMVGSSDASEAVLSAVEATNDVQVAKRKPRRARDFLGPAVTVNAIGSRKGMYLGAAVAVIALLVGAGIYYYPQYRQAQAIKEMVREDSRNIARIVENARKLTTEQIYLESYTPEIAQLSEMSTRVEKILMDFPGNIPLSSHLTRLKFLEFERKFAGLFDRKEFDAAAKLLSTLTADLSTVASKIPSDSSNSDIEDVLVTVQLAKYADILLKFRAFASEFPDISVNAPRKPSASRLDALQKLKARFVNIRRKSNRILSANNIVFKKIVDDVESHDIGLINAWDQILNVRN